MKTELHPIKNNVNLLLIQGVTLISLDDVDAWLYAIDMLPSERSDACKQIMADGHFSVCNIEYRVQVECVI